MSLRMLVMTLVRLIREDNDDRDYWISDALRCRIHLIL
jgi:hypothetical protein